MATGQWYKDYAAVQRRTPAGAGGASWAAYLKAKNATSEGYETAFKELDIAARQEGVTVNRPAMTAGMSQAQYQEVLQKYLVNINDEVLKKNVTAALKDIQSQGAVAGAHVQLPSLANLTSANAQGIVNSYIDIVNKTVAKNYVNMSLSDLRAQGVANGVNVPIPAVSNTVSQAQAQEIVNKYQSQVNKALLVKSTQDALKSVQSQAKSYGVNVAVPTISAGITEQAANALIDKYVADVNAKLSSVTVSESKPASNNQIQTSSRVNNALVGSATPITVVAPSVSIARNSDGSLAVNEGLYNQLKAAQTQHKSWWNDYSGIPQQVIDSQATDVRINSKGQFEWTPVTAADKAQLDKINVQRTRSGLAPRTTLIHGPEKSTEYNTKWLSTTGSGSRGVGESGVKIKDASGKTVKSYDYNTANLAKVGSGDIKIAAMKAGSSVNANATAKTNTAQSVKAVKIAKKDIVADVASVSVNSKQPIDYTKPFFNTTALASTAKLITKDLQKFQTVSQIEQNLVDAKVAKALEEAHKINPKGSKEYFEGVANVARRNTMSTKEIMKEDLARANKQIGEKVTTPVINELMKVIDARDKILADTSITITDKGKFSITEKGKESVKGVTYNANKVHKDTIKNSAVLSGYNEFMAEELEAMKNKPLNYAAELGAIYVGGAAFGAGLSGAKAVVNPRLIKTAGKVASKTGSKAVTKAATFGAKHAIDAAVIGVPVAYTAGDAVIRFSGADYKALTGIEKDIVKTQYMANLFKTGKELIVAAPGFSAGSKAGPKIVKSLGKAVKASVSKPVTVRKGPERITLEKNIDGDIVQKSYPTKIELEATAKRVPKTKGKTVEATELDAEGHTVTKKYKVITKADKVKAAVSKAKSYISKKVEAGRIKSEKAKKSKAQAKPTPVQKIILTADGSNRIHVKTYISPAERVSTTVSKVSNNFAKSIKAALTKDKRAKITLKLDNDGELIAAPVVESPKALQQNIQSVLSHMRRARNKLKPHKTYEAVIKSDANGELYVTTKPVRVGLKSFKDFLNDESAVFRPLSTAEKKILARDRYVGTLKARRAVRKPTAQKPKVSDTVEKKVSKPIIQRGGYTTHDKRTPEMIEAGKLYKEIFGKRDVSNVKRAAPKEKSKTSNKSGQQEIVSRDGQVTVMREAQEVKQTAQVKPEINLETDLIIPKFKKIKVKFAKAESIEGKSVKVRSKGAVKPITKSVMKAKPALQLYAGSVGKQYLASANQMDNFKNGKVEVINPNLSISNAISILNSVDAVIMKLPTTTNQGVKLEMKTSPAIKSTQVPTSKPVVKPSVKPVITPVIIPRIIPKITPVVNTVVADITKLSAAQHTVTATPTYRRGQSLEAGFKPPRKSKALGTYKKRKNEKEKLSRDIKNQLGSLSTLY